MDWSLHARKTFLSQDQHRPTLTEPADYACVPPRLSSRPDLAVWLAVRAHRKANAVESPVLCKHMVIYGVRQSDGTGTY